RRLVEFAQGGGTVGFGQSVEMDEVEAERLHLCDERARRRGAARRDTYGSGDVLLLPVRMVQKHVEHHRRAAEMRDPVLLDGREDEGGIDAIEADVEATRRRHGPGMAPAV